MYDTKTMVEYNAIQNAIYLMHVINNALIIDKI